MEQPGAQRKSQPPHLGERLSRGCLVLAPAWLARGTPRAAAARTTVGSSDISGARKAGLSLKETVRQKDGLLTRHPQPQTAFLTVDPPGVQGCISSDGLYQYTQTRRCSSQEGGLHLPPPPCRSSLRGPQSERTRH